MSEINGQEIMKRRAPMNSMIKAVLFDLDDTLYCEYDYVDQAFRSVAEKICSELEKKTQLNLAERDACESENEKASLEEASEEEAAGVAESYSVNNIHRRMWELLEENGRGRIFDDICAEYGVKIPISELVSVYRSTKPILRLYPDAEQILIYLQDKKIMTGLITDGCSQVQHAKIDAIAMLRSMDVILATDDLGKDETGKPYCKPNPYVYQYCLEKLGCEPSEAVYVGDNPAKDFHGARSLGMKTVRIVRMEGDHMKDIAEEGKEADHVIHTLLELEDLVSF